MELERLYRENPNLRKMVSRKGMTSNMLQRILGVTSRSHNKNMLRAQFIKDYNPNNPGILNQVLRNREQMLRERATRTTNKPIAARTRSRGPIKSTKPSTTMRNRVQAVRKISKNSTLAQKREIPPPMQREPRDGAGFSEKTVMGYGELYEFFQLMKEYQEKRGKVTRETASPMPILEEMYEYKKQMCGLARYPYTGSVSLIQNVVDNIRSLCADEGGNYTTYPILNQPNANKTNELMTMCLRSKFEKLLGSVRNNTGRSNTNVLLKISAIYDRFLRLLKDVDAEVALRLYVKDQSSQNLNTYIKSLSPNIQKSLTENVPNEYRSLINKLNKRVRNKKHNPIPVAVAHGPANHNTLSVSSMKKILRNPDIVKNFTEGSLFLKYLNEHIPSDGTGGCKMRGDVDGCLLRRRVVFGQPHPNASSGVKAIQTALSAINHGRMHRLKTFSPNGNRFNRVGEPKKNFTNFDILKKYMNTMKNTKVRNVPLFTSSNNRLLGIQKGDRVAVKFVGSKPDDKKLVKFDPSQHIENPHILWTTFGLHLDERGKAYTFFDFINFIYDRDKGEVKNLGSYIRPRGKMGMNYIIQLDSKTLDYLHNKYFFTNFTKQKYKNEIIQKLNSCRR
jgi:hypothetical protein